MLQTSFAFGFPSFVVGVLLALSYKRIAFVELMTPVMLGGFTLSLFVINLTEVCGEPTDAMR